MSTELHFGTLFEQIADIIGDGPALVHGEDRRSWSGFDDAAARLASFLADLGLAPDAKVALYLFNSNEYLVAQFAAFKQRLVTVNVNFRYLDDELAYVLDNSDAEVLVYHASLADRVAAVQSRCPRVKAWVEVDERVVRRHTGVTRSLRWDDIIASHGPADRMIRSEDDVYMLYTGGTTGWPKGVMFRMADFVHRLLAGYSFRGLAVPTDGASLLHSVRVLHDRGEAWTSIPACPLMHATGLWLGSFYAQIMGGSTVTLTGRRFGAAELWSAAQDEQANSITIVGDAFARPMLEELDRAAAAGKPYDLRWLRIIQSSGAMWSAEVQRGLLGHLDVTLMDSMGSTEAGMGRRLATRTSTITTAAFDLLASTRVITDDLRLVEPGSGEVGRIAASSSVPLGYYKDPVKSAATFPVIDGVRYALAGDHATVAADGSLVLLGRGSNCINTAGEKVFPEEVEEALKRHGDVVDALVVGLPDPVYGERIAAVVALRQGAAVHRDDLLAHVRSQLAGYKVPRMLIVVPEVTRAANGKADYAWARAELAGERA